jgi:hypothetical protein
MPDVRTYVMIVVEASWIGDDGAKQTASARMEDKSNGGACIRISKPIPVGTKISIQWRFEQFAGVVKYCRSEGFDYLIGIQRDASPTPAPKLPRAEASTSIAIAEKEPVKKSDPIILVASARPRKPEDSSNKIPSRNDEIATIVRPAVGETISRRRFGREFSIKNRPNLSHHHQPTAPKDPVPKNPASNNTTMDLRPESPGQNEAEAKRTFMGHKWFDKAPWNHKHDESKHDEPNPGGPDRSNTNGNSAKENSMSFPSLSAEKNAAHTAREVPTVQTELLAMEDIYVAAGIPIPRKNYGVKKVVEMLNNDHIRNLSSELKRASVLMALDAAGVSMDQIQRDAKARQDALNAYEAEQKKQAEADWARKAEEVSHIQSELESIKTHYMARINRNLEAVARDKARFNNWQMTKQEEAQSMANALDLCLKTSAESSAPHTEIPSTAPTVAASAVAALKP